jgi:hypothetical protein
MWFVGLGVNQAVKVTNPAVVVKVPLTDYPEAVVKVPIGQYATT